MYLSKSPLLALLPLPQLLFQNPLLQEKEALKLRQCRSYFQATPPPTPNQGQRDWESPLLSPELQRALGRRPRPQLANCSFETNVNTQHSWQMKSTTIQVKRQNSGALDRNPNHGESHCFPRVPPSTFESLANKLWDHTQTFHTRACQLCVIKIMLDMLSPCQHEGES